MGHSNHDHLIIHNEQGIIEKGEGAFHSPLEFSVKNLFYAVWSNRYKCSSRYAVKREYLEYYSVIYVIDGRMELHYEGSDIILDKDEAVLLDFTKPHEYRTKGDYLEKWEMVFKGNASDAYYEEITGKWGYKFSVYGNLKETICSLMRELSSTFPRDHNISVLIHTMLCGIIQQKAVSLSGPVEKAIAFMYDNYHRPLQIGEIADHAALSRYYFARRFQKETGWTPKEYLANIRIDAAREMLAEDNIPISQIADACGFINIPHFTSFFKKRTGQTPAAFRKVYSLKEIKKSDRRTICQADT